MPDVRRLLARLVEVEVVHAARIGVKDYLVVGLVIGVERLLPVGRRHAPVGVHFAQVAGPVERGEPHAGDEGVAHEHGEGASVADDDVGGLRSGDVFPAALVAGVFPFVDQARVDAAHDQAQPGDQVAQALVDLVVGNGFGEHAIGVGKVAEQEALRPGDLVALDVAFEIACRFDHVAQDRFWRQFVVVGPGNVLAIALEGGVEQIFERLGVGDLLQAVDALVVVDALGLHRGHGGVFGRPLLGAQDLPRVFERGFHHRDHVEGVGVGFGVEQFEGREHEGGKGLVEREVFGHVHGEGVVEGPRVVGGALDNPCGLERCEDLIGPLEEGEFFGVGLHAVADERAYAGPGIAALHDLVEYHGVRDPHAGLELFGLGFDQALEGLLVPAHEALGRGFQVLVLGFLHVAAGLGQGAGLFDVVFGGFGDHAAFGVEARPAGTPGDLVELARVEPAHLVAVVFGQGGEDDRVDGHVDAHAERVGAADYGQEPLLGELFHEQAVAGQHAGMVHAYACEQQAAQGLAEDRGELRAANGLLDLLALLLGGDREARQRLGALQGGVLGEVDDVEGRFAGAHGEFDGGFQGRVGELVGKRDGARGVGDRVDGAAGAGFERGGDVGRVAQGGAHEQELGVGEGQKRHLPGPAALGVGKEVELVHRDAADVGVFAQAQGVVGQDLGRAADDGGIGVDRAVAGDHAHVLAAEDAHQLEELLAHQGLDRGGVVGAAVGVDAHEAQAHGHERLAAPGGSAQNHVVAGGQVHKGVLLVGPQLYAARGAPFQEQVEGIAGVDVGPAVGVFGPGDHGAERAGCEGVGRGGGRRGRGGALRFGRFGAVVGGLC